MLVMRNVDPPGTQSVTMTTSGRLGTMSTMPESSENVLLAVLLMHVLRTLKKSERVMVRTLIAMLTNSDFW